MKNVPALAAALLFACTSALAQNAETVLVNGKIVTLDASGSVREALAIRDGKIAAVGRNTEIRKLAGKGTRVVDLKGRTVIPGLIDSHMHAVRAAMFFATEVNWIDTRSIPEAMQRVKDAGDRLRENSRQGKWLIVAGGWTVPQFKENRRPTQAELTAASGDTPAYVQLFYGAALLNPAGFKALNIQTDADVPPRGKL